MSAGLSFGVDALLELDGTLLLEEIVQAKEVVEPLNPLFCQNLKIIYIQTTFPCTVWL